MRVLVVTQRQWGQRIADHVQRTAPTGWQIAVWRGPVDLPLVLDEPEAYLPDALPEADLLLLLTESPGMTDLAPDVAQLCGAQAVILPVDKRSWAPPGLIGQVKRRLERMGVAGAFPTPFCCLVPGPRQHPLIRAFARRYGRPELACTVQDGYIASCQALRETPCGNTGYIVPRLANVPVPEAAERVGLLHHYYPCWGGTGVDPVQGTHSLMHVAATMAQKSVERALKQAADGKETDT